VAADETDVQASRPTIVGVSWLEKLKGDGIAKVEIFCFLP